MTETEKHQYYFDLGLRQGKQQILEAFLEKTGLEEYILEKIQEHVDHHHDGD